MFTGLHADNYQEEELLSMVVVIGDERVLFFAFSRGAPMGFVRGHVRPQGKHALEKRLVTVAWFDKIRLGGIDGR